MNKECVSKEKAIYQAVLELFEEGADLNNLTVAEITAKAGIGKGTAYEYFSDKEEMLAKAIIYNGEVFCKHLYYEASKEKNLNDKINLILCKTENQATNMNCMFRLMHMISDNSLISRRLQELKQNRTEEMLPVHLMKQIIKDEFQGKQLPFDEKMDYLAMSILSKILCYDMFLKEESYQQQEKKEAMRRLICQGICREVEKFYEKSGVNDMNRKWWKESVVYQIYPRSFMDSNGDGIGDINGITSKLDYLKELGIDVIWLSPVYQSPNDDNGYDISDYQAIMQEFGTMEDFDRMLAAAHERGIRIMMDLVVNHTSDEHKWFMESRKATDNPYRDYYIWRDGKDGKEPNNWGSCFGGSAWEYDEATDMYFLHLFSKKQPDLNWDNRAVRKEVFDMMTWWLNKGVDGFRMDVISMISKVPGLPDGPKGEGALYGDFGPGVINGPHVHDYLKEMRREVLSRFDTITVGETSGVTVQEAVKYAADDESELNMVFQFEQNDLDGGEYGKWNLNKISLPDLKEVFNRWQTYLEGKAWNSLYWNNHDQPRVVSRFGNDSEEYRELSAKMLATCLHMMKGTPYIYQGEEIGMTNVPFDSLDEFRDIESINAFHEYTENGIIASDDMMKYLNYKSRDNARTPMQWSSDKNAGFTDGTPWIKVNTNYTEINVEDQRRRENSVFHYYQRLISLRKKYPVIVYGKFELLLPEDEDIFLYTRSHESEKLLTLCNFSEKQRKIEIPAEFVKGEVLIANYQDVKAGQEMIVRPYEAVVLRIS